MRVTPKNSEPHRPWDEAASRFTGAIPEYYERALGPVIFADFADDIAHRAAASSPERVLETAAGTGIVTRHLRNLLPTGSWLTATDLNEAMLDIARAKFRPGEEVTFMPVDATELPFRQGAFDAVVCQYGVMFFPGQGPIASRGPARIGAERPLRVQRVGLACPQRLRSPGVRDGGSALSP